MQDHVELTPGAVAARDDEGLPGVGVASQDGVVDLGEGDRLGLKRSIERRGSFARGVERVLQTQRFDERVAIPRGVVEVDPKRRRALGVEASLDTDPITDREADARHRLQQAVRADVDDDGVAAACRPHDRSTSADIGERADGRADGHASLDHIRSRDVGTEVDEARCHHRCAVAQVGTQAHTTQHTDRVVQVDVVDEHRELVQHVDHEGLSLALHRPSDRGERGLGAVEDSVVRPCGALELGEDLLEVDLVQRQVTARHERQTQARLEHAERRRRHEVVDRHQNGRERTTVAELGVLDHVEHVLHGRDVEVRVLAVRLLLGPGELRQHVVLELVEVDVPRVALDVRRLPQQREAAVVGADVAVGRREEDVGEDAILLRDVAERPCCGLLLGVVIEGLGVVHRIGELRRGRWGRGARHSSFSVSLRVGWAEVMPLFA